MNDFFLMMTPPISSLEVPLTVPEATFPSVNTWVKESGRDYVVIDGLESVEPFFLSLVSASEQWFFCTSNGGLSAGRQSPDHALFPYLTVDKILENWNCTGPMTAIHCEGELWHPFWPTATHTMPIRRRLLKSMLGEELIFEERHQGLGLSFSYRWQLSDQYGFVRKVKLVNESDEVRSMRLVDGLQDLQAPGVDSSLHLQLSCLADAYKMSELECDGNLMIHRLASGIVDAPIPLENLKATTVWTSGFEEGEGFLSRRDAEVFLKTGRSSAKMRSRGERGAFLLGGEVILAPGESREWVMVAEIEQSHREVAELQGELEQPELLLEKVEADLEEARERLAELAASVDGFQTTADRDTAHYHYHNSLCNYLRGGLPESASTLGRKEFVHFLKQNNRELCARQGEWLEKLPENFERGELLANARESGDPDLERLAEEYLPLILGRRHGDPSRPWNRFNIRLKDEKGESIHHFEGNWRDIFQNWEALAWSYPDFLDGFISKFLNASTITGYNPYRVTSSGVDWEAPDEDDPWVSIGYWGDHQIVYLLKFLELKEKLDPNGLAKDLGRERYVFADVPYRFKSWQEVLKDPRDTIEFDQVKHEALMAKKEEMGGDGLLLCDGSGEVMRVSLLEKLLIPALAKLGQLVPNGGVWMNTQKPEWNDANNALAGSGISVVTTAYLYRYLQLVARFLEKAGQEDFLMSGDVVKLLERLQENFSQSGWTASSGLEGEERFNLVSASGKALEDYQKGVSQVSSSRSPISKGSVREFLQVAKSAVETVLKTNQRTDGLWHAYNVLDSKSEEGSMVIRRLPVMLEGQVAILSSELLEPEEALKVLEELPKSELRSKRHPTYLLYPDRELPLFKDLNHLREEAVMAIPTLAAMVSEGDESLVYRDASGCWRFDESLVNGYALADALDRVAGLEKGDRRKIEELYEEVFCHQSFTGRSGSMFGYEGLGCVYWHMVSKLMVAAQEVAHETFEKCEHEGDRKRAVAAYYSVQRGLGFRQTPEQYGAFPAEPYSHSQGQRGAQQPGLTGQVKEGILCRLGELGIDFEDGCLLFEPKLLRVAEFAQGDLSFTLARTPVVYRASEEVIEASAIVELSDGSQREFSKAGLDRETTRKVIYEEGSITRIIVTLPAHCLIS